MPSSQTTRMSEEEDLGRRRAVKVEIKRAITLIDLRRGDFELQYL